MSKATHRTIRKQLEDNAQHRREVEALDKAAKLKGFKPATVGTMYEIVSRPPQSLIPDYRDAYPGSRR